MPKLGLAKLGLARRSERYWPLALLAAGVVVWFGGWLVAPVPRMGGDVLTEFYPWLAYALAELRRGVLPLWGPYSLAGAPLLANPQLGLLYPLDWPLLLVLPVERALNWSAALHVGLAAAATYGLARRWGLAAGAALLAATCYGFNGFIAARLWAGNLNVVQVAAWLPVLLLAADVLRAEGGWRGAAALGTSLCGGLLVGFYQLWLLGALAAAAYLAFMPAPARIRLRRLVLAALAGAAALGLAAPQLLPAYELVGWSTRGSRLDWEFVADASLPLWRLPSLALPELFGSGAGTYWPGVWWHWHELTAYAGLLPLILLVLGLRRPRPAWVCHCAALGGLALLLALGRYTPLYGWFYQWVPGYGSFRDPGRHLILFSLMLALLAGRGADRLLAGEGRRAVVGELLVIVIAGAALAAGTALAAGSLAGAVVPTLQRWGLWSARPELAAYSPALLGELVLLLAARAVGLAVVAATLALVAVLLLRPTSRGVGAALLALAVFADLTIFAWRYLAVPQALADGVAFAAPAEQFVAFLGRDAVARLREEPGLWRTAVLGRDGVVAGNAGYVLGIPLAIGLDPLLPARYADVAALVNGRPAADFQNVALFLEGSDSPLWPLLNARFRLEPSASTTGGAPSYTLREDPAALPRAFVLDDVRPVPDGAAALAALDDPAFDPRRTVVLEVGATAPERGEVEAAAGRAGPTAPTAGPRPVEVREYRPGHVVVAASLASDGALILLEDWHPGWSASVDGRPWPVYPADHAFLGLRLPPGEHEVRLDFAPQSWSLGLLVAGATAAVVVLVALGGVLQARRWQVLAEGGDVVSQPARERGVG